MPAPILTSDRAAEIRERIQTGLPVGRQVRNAALAEVGEAWCAGCETAKPLGDFPRNRANKTGRTSVCKTCNAARCSARHAAQPETYRAQASRWAREHPEAVRAKSRRAASARRARLREAYVEDVDPQVVFERDEGVCGICNEPVSRERFDVDHVVPLAHGGEHSYANVRLAHVHCNRSRGRKIAAEMNRKEGM